MTHVIGSPPAPKGGATFEEVQLHKHFYWEGKVWKRNSAETGARVCGSSRFGQSPFEERLFEPDEPVTLLDITPRDPEPDPAVTTYGELRINDWFECIDPDMPSGLRQRFHGGHTFGTSVRVDCSPEEPVRRVAASVVVHEEPVTHVWADDADPSRVAILEPEKGRMSYGRAEAEAIARQITAWLAQEPASPESGEPEPASTWCENEAKPGGFNDGIAKPPEPAEDRSRPAPGYLVMEDRWTGGGWMAQPHLQPGKGGFFASEERAIAWTWAQHDAQQAGEGGES